MLTVARELLYTHLERWWKFMASSNGDIKPIRMQVYITEKMDESLEGLSELMGMGKNELVRYAIGNLVAGYNTGLAFAKEQAEKEIAKGSIGKLESEE